MLQEKIRKFLLGQYSKKEDSNQLKLYTILFATHGEFKNLYFISIAPMVCMSCAFVYDAVDINKIVVISSTKPPSYAYVQMTSGLNLYLG